VCQVKALSLLPSRDRRAWSQITNDRKQHPSSFLFFGKTVNSFSKPQRKRKEKTAVFFSYSLEKPLTVSVSHKENEKKKQRFSFLSLWKNPELFQ
jgi:hypothetical protein